MTATNADADYLDRMLRLHPGRDASDIIAARAAHLAARLPGDPSTGSTEDGPSVPEPSVATEHRILPERWHEQAYEVQVPLRAGGTKDGHPVEPGRRRISWWLWWIGLVILANVVRSVLTSRP